ncbi:Ig-like domain-containing protein [Actinotalea ferrariae]|nr:Ig-like domain-containing protein [Actinotalea ferrariae]
MGGSATVPLAGVAGVPTSGVRAVWLSVQALGRGAGAVSFAGSSLGAAGGSAARFSTSWSTSLVLAPLDAEGDLTYAVTGSATSDLSIAVVGWVAEGGVAASGGLVPAVAGDVAVTSSLLGLHHLEVAGPGIPSAVSGVVVRATVSTGALGGSFRAADSLLQILFAADATVPLPARATTTLTTVLPVDRSGGTFISVPLGARLTSLVTLGYETGPVATSADTVAPTLTIESPTEGAVVEQALTPEITVSGTVADAGSGVRGVTVTADGVDLGAAVVRGTSTPTQAWDLTTPVPAGTHTLSVVATDWAGRTTTATRSFTVAAAAPEEVVVAPDAEVLSPAERDAITSVETDAFTVAGTTTLRAGDVVVSDATDVAPDGLLRRITAVERGTASTVVRTEPAVITDALVQADIHLQDVPLDGSVVVTDEQGGSTARRAARSGVVLDRSFTILSPALKNEDGTAQVQVKANAGFTLTIDLEISMHLGWGGLSGELERFRFLVDTDHSLEVQAQLSTPSLEKKLTRDLTSISLGRVVVMAGPVPILFSASVNPEAFATFKASAAFVTTYTVGVTTSTGMEYVDGAWQEINETSFSAEPTVEIRATASVSAGLELQLSVKVYELAGPYVTMKVGPTVTATLKLLERTTTIALDLVFALAVGVHLDVLGHTLAEANVNLGELREHLAEWVFPWDGEPGGGDPGDGEPGGGDPGDGEPGGGDPGDGEPGDGDPGDGGPGGGSGFGLVDTGLASCLPSYVEQTLRSPVTYLGLTEDELGRRYAVSSQVASTLSDEDISAWAAVMVRMPGRSTDERVIVSWDRDPEGWWNQNHPEIYSEEGYNQAHNGASDTWFVNMNSMQENSLLDGYTEFTVYLGSLEVPSMEIWVELDTRRQIPNPNEDICGAGPGQKIADGRPWEQGLHWDLQVNKVQLSLESSLLPAGTASVGASCTVTANGGADWPLVGETTTTEMIQVDHYERWTHRFGWGGRTVDAYVGWIGIESYTERTCEAVAYDADGAVLEVFPVVGGAFSTPNLEPQIT